MKSRVVCPVSSPFDLPVALLPRKRFHGLRFLARTLLFALAGVTLLGPALPTARAQTAATLISLYSFSGPDGIEPFALAQGSDGNFYGTTNYGGPGNQGLIFQLTPTGSLTSLHLFGGADGAFPDAALLQGSDGNFYGTTYGGGANSDGTVFQVSPAGGLTTLHAFTGSDGAVPYYARLAPGSDGNFYGTTNQGGANGDGTIFRITSAGVLTSLHSFSGPDGANPQAGLVLGGDGNFYGTTDQGGTSNAGTVFRVTPQGAVTSLHSFSGPDGAGPFAGLIPGGDGNFYGTSFSGGPANAGTVFRLTPAGALTTIHSFSGSDGAGPFAGLIQGSDGNFYGTTSADGASGGGTVFQVTPVGMLTTLASFGGSNGSYPDAALVQGIDGSFYGTTQKGGIANDGTIFKVTVAGIGSPGDLQLSAATATVTESFGNVIFSVNRVAGSNGAVSASYSTADLTALAGTDYQAVSGTLSWADGDASSKSISVPITDRHLASGSASFLVNLSQAAGGALLGAPAQATVTILQTDTNAANIQSVSLLSPPANFAVTQNQSVAVAADVEALSGTLTNVEFFVIDSAGNRTDLGGTTSPRGQKTWQPAVPGDYTLQVVATDIQGKTTPATEPVQVLAAATVGAAPQANLYGGLAGRALALGSALPVVAEAVDSNGDPLQNAQFFLDGVPVATTPVTESVTARATDARAEDAGTSPLFQAVMQLTKAVQQLTVVGTTASGASAVSNATVLYTKALAGQPPSAAISNFTSGATVPAGTAGQSVTVSASTGSQPINRVELVVDNQSVGTATAAPYSFTLPALLPGSHAMSVIATDIASLCQVSAPVIIKAEQTAPSNPSFFVGQAALANGVYYLAFPNGNYFGYYSYLADPAYIFHFDLGYEYVFDAVDANAGAYFYDFKSSDFFYTSPAFPFPYLYDFGLQSTVYYYPDPDNAGHYNTDGVRYFYVFSTGAIISK